ncbi:MAG: hypothetical protein Pg6B_06050 [Candidatus Azobacteroides pseudotrichonymphae]|jgi:peptide chain release factor 3|nr:MAG: hypothetical protein Pg6B_06050 [Candidatus Azobacteroides pseudotrichonymphae]
MKFSQVVEFMEQKKGTVDSAYAGDIIGILNAEDFKIGDTLTLGKICILKICQVFPRKNQIY